MKSIKTMIAGLLLGTGILSAQTEKISLENAINQALKNNYDIQVARNDAAIARTNNTAGNAGLLPSLELTGSGSLVSSSVHQTLTDGNKKNFSSTTTGLSAGTQLSWTLYDGGKMFVTRTKLNEIQKLGEIQFREQVMQTVFNVISAYYDVVRQQQQLASIQEALNYNQERLTIAQTGFKAGTLAKTDMLTAQMDYNVTAENIINQKTVIDASKKALNVLLGKQANADFTITDIINTEYQPNKAELLAKLYTSNASINAQQQQKNVADLAVKETQTAFLPQFSVKAGYYLSQTGYNQGDIDKNFNAGPQFTGNLTVPLFKAGENKRKANLAKIQAQTAEIELKNIQLQISAAFENAFTEWENQQKLLKIETANQQLAIENMKISLDRLKHGQTTSLEVRLAQEDLVQSNTRIINFRYKLCMAEAKLKQLVAEL